MWLIIQVMRLIFLISYYQLIRKFQRFVKLCKCLSANMKVLKIQLSKTVQLQGYLPGILGPFDKILGSSMRTGLEVLGIIGRIKAKRSFRSRI